MPSPGETVPGRLLAFSPDTADIREADWTVANDASAEAVTLAVDSLASTFGLEEMLHAARDKSVSLQLDPDSYLFSYIQAFSDRPECVLPDRADMTYATHCLRSFSRHALDVATRRGATVTTSLDDEPGTFLADDERIVAEDLLQVPRGRITEHGMRENIRLVLENVALILAGEQPAAGLSTIELCRAQLWQWVRHDTGVLDTGRIVTPELFRTWLAEDLEVLQQGGDSAAAEHGARAAALLDDMSCAAQLGASLVEEAYRLRD